MLTQTERDTLQRFVGKTAPAERWQPDTDWAQMGEVYDALIARGWQLYGLWVIDLIRRYNAVFERPSIGERYKGQGLTVPIAICRAALRIAEEPDLDGDWSLVKPFPDARIPEIAVEKESK